MAAMEKGLKQTTTPFHRLFENEEESDSTLIVGNGSRERIPVHSWVLSKDSEYFRRLFYHSSPPRQLDQTYYFEDDSPRGFTNFIRWLYQKHCQLHSIQTALETLCAAKKYLCPDLAQHCIEYVSLHLQKCDVPADDVLLILEWIRHYCSTSAMDSSPSAPPIEMEEVDCSSVNEVSEFDNFNNDSHQDLADSCDHLRNQCLELVDLHAEKILASEHIESIHKEILKLIIQRSSLKIDSELSVIEALCKWSTAMCKKQQIPIIQENRRHLLGELVFLARFLTLNKSGLEKLVSIQSQYQLLRYDEMNYVAEYIGGKEVGQAPPTMKPCLEVMRTPRQSQLCAERPVQKQVKKKKKIFSKEKLMFGVVEVLVAIFD